MHKLVERFTRKNCAELTTHLYKTLVHQGRLFGYELTLGDAERSMQRARFLPHRPIVLEDAEGKLYIYRPAADNLEILRLEERLSTEERTRLAYAVATQQPHGTPRVDVRIQLERNGEQYTVLVFGMYSRMHFDPTTPIGAAIDYLQ